MTAIRPTLSPAQMRVLVLVAEGYSNPDIAKALFLSVNTVKTHLIDLREALGARDRAHAVAAVLPASASLWCFGSARMFLEHTADFDGWKFGQEALWLKRNGSGPGSRDGLTKVHEWAYHWYRGRWSDLHHEWEREPSGGIDKSTRRQAHAAKHRRPDRSNAYTDDGYRQPRSVTWVIEAPSVRYQKRHQDEKPVKVVVDLIRECTPPGELVLDPGAGVGTTGIAARLCGRRALLIEREERHCEEAAKRLSADMLPVETDGAA